VRVIAARKDADDSRAQRVSEVKRIAVVCLCAVAFAMTASASVAQAEDAYFRCVKSKGGEYAEGECATKAPSTGRGDFERESAVGVSYISGTAKSEKVVLSTPGLEVSGRPAIVTCKQGARTTGDIATPDRDEEVITFQACELIKQHKRYCTSAARPLGAIRTNTLETELVEVAPSALGEVFRAQGGVDGVIAEFSCGARALFRITGFTVGEITAPLPEHASLHSTLVFESALDLETELSNDGGATWLGPFPSELKMITTNRDDKDVKLGIEP
jgi:hypothetical protein